MIDRMAATARTISNNRKRARNDLVVMVTAFEDA